MAKNLGKFESWLKNKKFDEDIHISLTTKYLIDKTIGNSRKKLMTISYSSKNKNVELKFYEFCNFRIAVLLGHSSGESNDDVGVCPPKLPCLYYWLLRFSFIKIKTFKFKKKIKVYFFLVCMQKRMRKKIVWLSKNW